MAPRLSLFLFLVNGCNNIKSLRNLSMPNMGLRSIFTICFFLLLLITLPLPSLSRVEPEEMHSEVYEIDYRGPETHSWVPPPHRSHGLPHQKTTSSSLTAPNPMVTSHTQNRG